MEWGELVSNSRGIEVNNRMFRPRGPSSAVTQCNVTYTCSVVICNVLAMVVLYVSNYQEKNNPEHDHALRPVGHPQHGH